MKVSLILVNNAACADEYVGGSAAPDVVPYAVSHNSCYRWLVSVFTFVQTQKQSLEAIHVKIMFIWRDVAVSATHPDDCCFV